MTRQPGSPIRQVDELVLRVVPEQDAGTDSRRLTVEVERGGQLAGSVGIREHSPGTAELVWEVHPDHRRRRVATRAVRFATEFAFAELGIRRVEAYCPRADQASQWVATRAGLRFECYRRGLDGDDAQYAALPGDPEPGTRESFLAQLNARMPKKRVIAQALVTRADGRFLLCELTYKREWDLPGGVVDPGESPARAVVREMREELGVDLPLERLLAVNWLAPYRQWDDAMLFVFKATIHTADISRIALEPREIRAIHWCSPDEARERVAPYLAALLPRLVAADGTEYLESSERPTWGSSG